MKRSPLNRYTPLKRVPPRPKRRNTRRLPVNREQTAYQFAVDAYPESVCWLAQFTNTPCNGRLQRVHLISKQRIKRALRSGAGRLRAEHMELSADEIVWDDRAWVPGCEAHHHMLDQSRKLQIPRWAISPATEQYAREYGLMVFLELEYGPLEAA